MSIEVKNLTKRFGGFTALDDVCISARSGELLALLGPSGSGKTTLLRVIAGLEFPDRGSVHFHGDDATQRDVRERQVGFVFQHYALFKHMSVFENVAFGLRVRPARTRPSRAEIKERVTELLKLVQLERMADRFPAQLSGGQRQRVALARALAIEPKVLLLDEPFGALDAQVRKDLRRWLRRLHDEIHLTSVFVTHDQEEALELADRVVVMNHGKVEQVGTPEDVYHRPATPFVCSFLGNVNLFHARLEPGVEAGPELHLVAPNAAPAKRATARIFVRPHLIDIVRQSVPGSIAASVEHINVAGPVARIELGSPHGPIFVELTPERFAELRLREGDQVHALPRESRTFVEDYAI